jgi:hypothetical protein
MRNCPTVRTWKVTYTPRNGAKSFRLVLAPTRKLALLNFRFQDGGADRFAPIHSIGLVARSPRDTSTRCHCGTPLLGSDHCSHCACETFESYACDLVRHLNREPSPTQRLREFLDDSRTYAKADQAFGRGFRLGVNRNR